MFLYWVEVTTPSFFRFLMPERIWQNVLLIAVKEILHLWQQDVLIHHTEHRKMKGMFKLWRQVVLIQHTEDRSKSLILIIEDRQDILIQHTEDKSKLLILIVEDQQDNYSSRDKGTRKWKECCIYGNNVVINKIHINDDN